MVGSEEVQRCGRHTNPAIYASERCRDQAGLATGSKDISFYGKSGERHRSTQLNGQSREPLMRDGMLARPSDDPGRWATMTVVGAPRTAGEISTNENVARLGEA